MMFHFSLGKTVVRLEYEAYMPMAKSEMRKICKQVREKWDVIKIAIFHRIGYDKRLLQYIPLYLVYDFV